MQYLPIILVCLLGRPDAECNETNPDVTKMIGQPQNNIMSCMREGMALTAATEITRQADHYYVRYKCKVR